MSLDVVGEGNVMSWGLEESLGLPNEGPWITARNNSEVSQSKEKASLFRETLIPQAEFEPFQKVRGVAPKHDLPWESESGRRIWGLCFLWAKQFHRLMSGINILAI